MAAPWENKEEWNKLPRSEQDRILENIIAASGNQNVKEGYGQLSASQTDQIRDYVRSGQNRGSDGRIADLPTGTPVAAGTRDPNRRDDGTVTRTPPAEPLEPLEIVIKNAGGKTIPNKGLPEPGSKEAKELGSRDGSGDGTGGGNWWEAYDSLEEAAQAWLKLQEKEGEDDTTGGILDQLFRAMYGEDVNPMQLWARNMFGGGGGWGGGFGGGWGVPRLGMGMFGAAGTNPQYNMFGGQGNASMNPSFSHGNAFTPSYHSPSFGWTQGFGNRVI